MTANAQKAIVLVLVSNAVAAHVQTQQRVYTDSEAVFRSYGASLFRLQTDKNRTTLQLQNAITFLGFRVEQSELRRGRIPGATDGVNSAVIFADDRPVHVEQVHVALLDVAAGREQQAEAPARDVVGFYYVMKCSFAGDA